MHKKTCEICLLFFSNHAFVLLLFHDLPKNYCVRFREVNFKANDHAVPKIVPAINSVRYKIVLYIEDLL